MLANAIKFTPEGGQVEIQLERMRDPLGRASVLARVKDTGQGISREFLPYVFDRFRQANSTTTRLHGGLGLGLEVVRYLVELHGGMVYADSLGEAQGATFTVKLPLLTTAVDQGNFTPELPVEKAPRGDSHLLNGLRVLVVDDEVDARDLVAICLTQCGADVTAVGSVEEAIAAVEQLPPSILVSDIGLPGEDGYELIRQVKTLTGRGRQTPAIALTAFARDEDKTRALAAGFQMYLSKPINPHELIQAVQVIAR